MTVRIYKSTDTSAPTVSGTIGSLVALLDACLVNGYGSSTAAGWTKSFSGTNKATYRNSASAGTGFYLYVDDSATGSGSTAREARMTGFETQSTLGVGTGPFPTAWQCNPANAALGYVICRKSTTADSTARAWTLLADETVFYLFIAGGDVTTACTVFTFGDIYSYKPSDVYRCAIAGRFAENNAGIGSNVEYTTQVPGYATFESGNNTGEYVARSYTGWGGSVPVVQNIPIATSSASTQWIGSYASGIYTYPNATDGALLMSPVYLIHNKTVRGYRKGLWAPLQSRPCAHYDTFSGSSSGGLNGKTFLAIDCGSQNSAQLILETSNTW